MALAARGEPALEIWVGVEGEAETDTWFQPAEATETGYRRQGFLPSTVLRMAAQRHLLKELPEDGTSPRATNMILLGLSPDGRYLKGGSGWLSVKSMICMA
jgi:hypothetical protein